MEDVLDMVPLFIDANAGIGELSELYNHSAAPLCHSDSRVPKKVQSLALKWMVKCYLSTSLKTASLREYRETDDPTAPQ